MKLKTFLRNIYISIIMYTNNLYNLWELIFVFCVGVVFGGYLLY